MLWENNLWSDKISQMFIVQCAQQCAQQRAVSNVRRPRSDFLRTGSRYQDLVLDKKGMTDCLRVI